MEKMYKLSKEEKEDLSQLIKKPGYKVLIKIADELELSVLRKLKTIDTDNKTHLAILAKNTQYLLGIEHFMKTVKSGTNQIALRKEED